MNMKKLTKKEMELMINNSNVRIWVAKKSFYMFFLIYFAKYITYDLAPFQEEMIFLSEDDSIKLLNILSFPDAWKTTFITLAYSIWNYIKWDKNRIICIASKSISISKSHLENIKYELLNNSLLQKDFSHQISNFEYKRWELRFLNNSNIIKAVSPSTQIDLKINNRYPDIIICDNLEDIDSIKNEKYKELIHCWFMDSLYPLTLDNTKIITIWKYLDEESLQNKISEIIKYKDIVWTSKSYPIIQNKEILWKSKYSQNKLDNIKSKVWDVQWTNNYLLERYDVMWNLKRPDFNVIVNWKKMFPSN